MDILKVIKDHELWLETRFSGQVQGERADLSWMDLFGLDLANRNLSLANMQGCNLTNANLQNANLDSVNLNDAILDGADFQGTKMDYVKMKNVSVKGVKNLPYIPMTCPDDGEFIGYKKASGFILELLIPSDALRSSSTDRRCRCSKAKVLSVTNKQGQPQDITEVPSSLDNTFIYHVGEMIHSDFDDNRFLINGKGIHFFMEREEAVEYENY